MLLFFKKNVTPFSPSGASPEILKIAACKKKEKKAERTSSLFLSSFFSFSFSLFIQEEKGKKKMSSAVENITSDFNRLNFSTPHPTWLTGNTHTIFLFFYAYIYRFYAFLR